MMKTILAFAVAMSATAANAAITCNISQGGKTIQTESVAISYSGPITGEAKAAFSILTQADGTSNLCIITDIAPDATVMCTTGKTDLNLQYNDKLVVCHVQ